MLSMKNIVKSFPGVRANNDVSINVDRQTIHALIGENGAGKSTLMNILCGLYQPDSGEIEFDGERVNIGSTFDAIKKGIGMVHQHFMLVPETTVLENVLLGSDTPSRFGLTDYRKGRNLVKKTMAQFNFDIDLDKMVYELSVGEMQRVEIIKALHRGCEILILDEPTAVLTPSETESLFSVMRKLVEMGKTIIFISHKLKEVLAVSDYITVMRQGRVSGNVRTVDTCEVELARMMVGRDVVLRVKREASVPKEEILRLEQYSADNDRKLPAVREVSFDVRAGEIVGIAGVDGNGQTELVEAITGMRKHTNGSIFLNGKDISAAGSLKRRRMGISHIPADRMVFGVNEKCSVEENLILSVYNTKHYSRRGVLLRKELRRYATRLVKKYQVVAASVETRMGTMSGGNMQKIVVAREFSTDPVLLVAAQPTRGVDVGAIEFIHKELLRMRDEGKGILLISMELEEILALADRILVMYEGDIVAELENKNLDEAEIGLYMTGAKRMERMR
jgi:simple sugar transport system ATP-binding protein